MGKLDLGILFFSFDSLMKVCAVGQVVPENDQCVFCGPVEFVRACGRSLVTTVTHTKKGDSGYAGWGKQITPI